MRVAVLTRGDAPGMNAAFVPSPGRRWSGVGRCGALRETPLAEVIRRIKPIDPALFELARVLSW